MGGEKSFQEELGELRAKISQIDVELLRLLNERVEVAQKVGALKGKHGRQVEDSKREEELLDFLARENEKLGGKLPAESLRAIYQKILHSSKNVQRRLIREAGGWDWE